MPRPAFSPPSQAPGFAARRVASEIVEGVLHRGRSLDEQLDGATANQGIGLLSDRDRALVRRIVGTTLRRLGTLRHLIASCLDRGLPADAARLESALLVGAAQIHVLDIPDHAAVDLSVRLVQADRRSARYAGLVNAVLRRIARSGAELMADRDPVALDTPGWLLERWSRSYGPEVARAIAAAHTGEPALDLTVKADPETWATRLRGKVLPTGTVRLVPHGPVSGLPGYTEGDWWVQDAAAALPARLLGPVAGLAVADLCAAPGGKTLQLAAAGARVTAVDRSEARLARLRDNLARVGVAAETIAADVTQLEAGPFDAVLLDAPCSSTGTVRRHPDIPWRKTAADLVSLAGLQASLLDRAVGLLREGGTLVYCTCSLEPEEGEGQIEALLARDPRVVRKPVTADEFPGLDGLVTAAGDLRTLPALWPDPEPRMGGLDGFYAARLERR
ncbi:RsmB/NOP family class I SAM-dependent RNA methyltransferase [Rhodoplanes roseus]|uniref:MFS transporter n=1 Tax=Rhodoplanes roseus TaxID=29409 RepID=A0A327KXF2_9BRAD|nr:transcription antitermination factor NusB [Rhodoplanes roseus]RAI41892.1 MFS transporter [Rhodoplanes roseus]